MSTWNISKWNGSTWVADGTIPRPNDDMVQELTSTQQMVVLADGSKAFLAPETKKHKQAIVLVWLLQDTTLKTKIETYINDHEYLKITTHAVGIEFIGRFTAFRPIWLIGQSPDAWDMEAVFEVME